MKIYKIIFKRFFDIFLSLFILIILSPLMMLIVALLYIFNNGTVFFQQARLGMQAEPFNLYKFRTMKKNSHKLLDKYLDKNHKAQKEWESNQKLYDDPRITKIGWFLREYSLDELPQFINVIKGEMSIVGPRPIVKDEISKYNKFFNSYITVRPGITGLWQVSGRNNTTYNERIDYDIYYIKNMSFILDFYIILKTIPAILAKDGAY